jgi:serine O-acetyltransferase
MTSLTPLECSREQEIALHASPSACERPRPWYQLIYRDYRRYIATEETAFRTLWSPGFWASSFYRISRALVQSARPTPIRRLIRVGISIMQRFVEIATVGIEVQPECEIGEGLYIGHQGTIVLPAHGSLGSNCNVAQGVTIGLAGVGERRGAPRIGNRVFIGTNAVVAGKITVGDDAMICAGSVVTRSVPPRAVMVGNPARVVSYDGSFDYVLYDGMDRDPQRLANLARRGQPDVPSAASAAS